MQLSNIVVTPVGGWRLEYVAPATSSLTVGGVVSLTPCPDPAEGMLAAVESTRLVRGTVDTIIGDMRVIAAHSADAVTPPRGPLYYASSYAQQPSRKVLESYFREFEPIRLSDGTTTPQVLVAGVLQQNRGVHVAFAAGGFNRHTAWLAASGTGKSYSLGVLLEELLLRTSLRLVIFDPNGD